MIEQLKMEALNLARHNGARPDSVKITELELIPVQYTTNNAVRAIAKAVSTTMGYS